MRRYFPFFGLLTLLLVFSGSYAQPYESLFGSQSTSWNLYTGEVPQEPFTPSTTDSLVAGYDTIIGGKNYKTIHRYLLETNDDPYLYGFLREDTMVGKAWFKFADYPGSTNDTVERLIMDLSYTMDSVGVDTIFYVNGRKHIRFTSSPTLSPRWNYTHIEGVGPASGIDSGSNDEDKAFNQTMCQKKNDTLSYQHYDKEFFRGACNTLYLSVEQEYYLSTSSLLPNPAKTSFIIVNQYFKELHLQLFTMTGKLVLNDTHYVVGDKVSLSELQSGLYLLKTTSLNGDVGVHKLIVE